MSFDFLIQCLREIWCTFTGDYGHEWRPSAKGIYCLRCEKLRNPRWDP